MALSLNGLGLLAQDRGNLDKADQYFRQALEIRQKQTPNGLDVAAAYNNPLVSLEQDRVINQSGGIPSHGFGNKRETCPESLDAPIPMAAWEIWLLSAAICKS